MHSKYYNKLNSDLLELMARNYTAWLANLDIWLRAFDNDALCKHTHNKIMPKTWYISILNLLK